MQFAAPTAVPMNARRPRSSDDPDQRVILNGMTWKDYEILLTVLGDRSGVRMYFLDQAVELMSPSRSHEDIKTTLARLLFAYCEERNIEVTGYGSWTLKNVMQERGAEPDECYMVGETNKDLPDFAVEVVWTHGGLNKLEIYRGLGVPEVWQWDQEHGLRVFALREGAYEERGRSQFLPELDPAWLARFLDQATQTQSVRALRAALRGQEAE